MVTICTLQSMCILHSLRERNAPEYCGGRPQGRTKVKKQSHKRLDTLMRQYPAITLIRTRYIFMKDDKWDYPDTHIVVQKPDPELIYRKGKCHWGFAGYISRANGDRGWMNEHLYTVNVPGNILHILGAHIDWSNTPDLTVKDIFDLDTPDAVDYLVWVTYEHWYKPSSDEEERNGQYFGEDVGPELTFVVYPRPKDKTWQELIDESTRIKEKRENTYKFPPKETPELPGLMEALQEGEIFHAFLSGGGLRVIHSRDSHKGYGENIHIEEALVHANEDWLAGGRPYGEVYGPIYPHYLTGDSMSSSNIDAWVRQGQTFNLWYSDNQVVCELHGYINQDIPEWVQAKAKESPGTIVAWESRGFLFGTAYVIGLFPGNGEDGFSSCIMRRLHTSSTKNSLLTIPYKKLTQHKSRRKNRNAWFYKVTKTATGADIWEAMQNALAAEEVEVSIS